MAVDSICVNGHRGPADPAASPVCGVCGASVAALCPNGHQTALGSRFCGTCGAPVGELPVAVPAPTGPGESTIPVQQLPTAAVPAAPLAAPSGARSPQSEVQPTPEAKGSNRTALLVALAVVAVLAVGGLVFLFASKSSSTNATSAKSSSTASSKPVAHASTTSTTVAPSTTQTTINLAAHQEAQLLSNLLSQSAGDRSAVIGATQAIASCGDVTDAIRTLNAAATSRQNLIQELNGLTVTDIPNGIALAQTLQQAWQASVASDQSYAQWGENQSFECGTNDTADSNYIAASQSDQTATTDKTQFANMWAGIAQQYNLPAYTPQQI